MTIDAKWLLPFVLPFVLYGWARALWWLAGAVWVPEVAAAMSITTGAIAGGLAVFIMFAEGICWPIHIGRKP